MFRHLIRKILPLTSLIILLCSCSINRENLTGVYVAQKLNNNLDTLRLLDNGTYIKDLYRKNDNSLVYHNTGKWDYNDGRITLHDFFLDEDQIYSKEAGAFENVLLTSSLIVKRRLGRVVIYYRQSTDYSYYEKQ